MKGKRRAQTARRKIANRRRASSVPSASCPPGRATGDARRPISEIKAEFQKRIKARLKTRKPPEPAPRYDALFFEGLEWLDNNG
jgi:hypothetical protein